MSNGAREPTLQAFNLYDLTKLDIKNGEYKNDKIKKRNNERRN